MSTRCPNTRPPCLRSGQGRGWKSHEPLDAALTRAAGAGEIGCLARTKSFFQKTLRSPRGAFGRVRGGSGDEDQIPAEDAGMTPGSRRGAFFRGLGHGGGSLDSTGPEGGGAADGGLRGGMGRSTSERERRSSPDRVPRIASGASFGTLRPCPSRASEKERLRPSPWRGEGAGGAAVRGAGAARLGLGAGGVRTASGARPDAGQLRNAEGQASTDPADLREDWIRAADA